MHEFIDNTVTFFINSVEDGGFLLGMFIIILESIIPILPLAIFIAFNIMAFGYFLGFLISYIATILGCLLAYFLVRKLFSNYVYRKSKENQKLNKAVNSLEKIKFTSLVLILALPFTPAFLINISAGLIKYNFKKFVYALLLSKISIVAFWGYIGSSAINNMKEPRVLIVLTILVLFCYWLSKIVNKKFKVE